MKKSFLMITAAAIMAAGCTSNDQKTTDVGTTVDQTETTMDADADAVATITINGGDDMKFDLSEIKVKAGQTVKLTLKHTGTMAKNAMGHNFVLLAQGVDLKDFSSKAIAASTTDYVPAANESDVIAHTKLLGGGESDTIEFTAPAKGTYEFLCSFPGHSALMKGTFIVE